MTKISKVVGEYERKSGNKTYGFYSEKYVFNRTGRALYYLNEIGLTPSSPASLMWNLVDGEIHINNDSPWINVFRINEDKSITSIATIEVEGGKRTDEVDQFLPDFTTYKKIK